MPHPLRLLCECNERPRGRRAAEKRDEFASPHIRSQAQETQHCIAFLLRHSPAAPPSHCLPTRFRALALFGRRPAERVVRSVLPASENLHISGREQMQQ